MKRLISIIGTKGKSPEQAAKEVFQAHQKYHKVKQSVLNQQINKRHSLKLVKK